MPYFGSGMAPADVYWYRSCIFPALRIGIDTRQEDQDYGLLKQMIQEYRHVEKYLLGDYYPLTVHSLTPDVWAGWQFDRPELSGGIVQAFRRAESPYETARFRLRGLEQEAVYRLQDLDRAEPAEWSGRDLMETGLLVSLPQPRSSCLVRYQRVDRTTGVGR